MPRVAITPQTLDRDGVVMGADGTETTGDSVNNHVVADIEGTEYVAVRNSDASPHNVTFVTQQTIDGQAVADRVEAIPAGELHLFGPFPRAQYSESASGDMHIDVDSNLLHLMVLRP